MVGVEQWAEVRRLVLVEKVLPTGGREADGVGREDVDVGEAAVYSPRPRVGSKLDPFTDGFVSSWRQTRKLTSPRSRGDGDGDGAMKVAWRSSTRMCGRSVRSRWTRTGGGCSGCRNSRLFVLTATITHSTKIRPQACRGSCLPVEIAATALDAGELAGDTRVFAGHQTIFDAAHQSELELAPKS